MHQCIYNQSCSAVPAKSGNHAADTGGKSTGFWEFGNSYFQNRLKEQDSPHLDDHKAKRADTASAGVASCSMRLLQKRFVQDVHLVEGPTV